MNKWRIAFVIAFCCMALASAQAVQLVPFTPHGVTCDLLQDNFENTDGVDITTHGWTADGADPGDFMEIDTARFQGGSSSLLTDNDGDSNTYLTYKSITQQSSGKFTSSFWAQWDVLSPSKETQIIQYTVGAPSPETRSTLLRQIDNDVQYYNGSYQSTSCSTTCLTEDTWHHFELEMDMDANTFNLWLDGSQIVTNGTFQSNIDPDRLYFNKRSNVIADTDHWRDTLCVYSGARQ